jgi:hypothetical protein
MLSGLVVCVFLCWPRSLATLLFSHPHTELCLVYPPPSYPYPSIPCSGPGQSLDVAFLPIPLPTIQPHCLKPPNCHQYTASIFGLRFEARGSRTFHVIEPFRISCGCPDSPDPLCAYDMTDIPFQHLTSNWSWPTRYFHCMSLPSKSACGLLSSHESPAPSSLLSCPDERGVLGRVSSTLCPLAEDESCDRDAF